MNKLALTGVSLLALAASTGMALAEQATYDPADVSGSIVYYTHWTNYIDSGDFDRWEAEFKTMYPNVGDIDIQGISTYAETMATRLATGDYGDVLEISDALTNEELGDFLLPLNDMGISDIMYFNERWSFEGEEYAYTFGVNAEGLVYNKQAFADAGIDGVPTTYTELKAAAEALKASGSIPLIINMGSGWPLSAWDGLATAMSGDTDYASAMLANSEPWAADQPHGRAIAILKEFIDNGWVEEDLTGDHWQDSKGWMASGQGAMWFLGNWSVNQIIDEGSALAGVEGFGSEDLGYFPLPYDDSGSYNVNSGPDWAMAINVDTDNPVLAKAWIDFLLTKSDLGQIAGFIPSCTCMEPTLPQLAELNSYGPNLVGQGTPPSEYTEAMNTLGYAGGNGVRDLLLADDFDASVAALNERWGEAVARASR